MTEQIMSNERDKLTNLQWYTACWNYFSLLSGQRMQMLQYYISLEVFLCGSFITLASLTTKIKWAEIAVSSLIVIISIIFRGLDHRTKTMIHSCEESMIVIETTDASISSIHPITNVNACKIAKLTYTKWIITLQAMFSLTGIISIILVTKDIL